MYNIINVIASMWHCTIVKIINQWNGYYLQFLRTSRGYMSQILLLHIIHTTPPNQLLNVGPIFRLHNRTYWMKTQSNDWWGNVVQKEFSDEDWLENFRMTRTTFVWLCEQLTEDLAPSNKSLKTRESLSVQKQVAVALYFLANCAEYRIVGDTFGIHKSTVHKCVYRVVKSINEKLSESYLSLPNDLECQDISNHFENKTHIPQLIGAIDRTDIPILPPSDGYRDFINRKGWPSIILQAVVDHMYRFRNINAKMPGSFHDAAVFEESPLFKEYEILIPKSTKNVNGTPVPYMLMADSAYPLLPWVMKSYTKSVRLSPEEELFNVHLNSGHVAVEIAFRRLKSRWRCLLNRLDIHYTFVPDIVTTCCILHNIMESRKETFIKHWENTMEAAEITFPQPSIYETKVHANFTATIIRDKLKNYLAANFPLQ